MIRVDGYDRYGIPRVYGWGKNIKQAETQARWACQEYLNERPGLFLDRGTIDKWSFRAKNIAA